MARVPVARSGAEVLIAEDKGVMHVMHVNQQFTFAFELKNAARVLAKKAQETQDADGYEMKAFVTGAVSLSYSYLEAAYNEFLLLNAIAKDSPLSEAEKAVIGAIGTESLRPQDKTHTLQLFNLALRLLKKPEMKEGEQPYQAANLVRKLRNLLIHPMPGRVVTYEADEDHDLSTQQDIVKQLKSHLGLGKHATFPWDVLTSNCATWAVRSCEEFFHDFVARSGVDPGFITE